MKSINLENDGHEKEQIIGIIKQAEAGLPIKDLRRKGGLGIARGEQGESLGGASCDPFGELATNLAVIEEEKHDQTAWWPQHAVACLVLSILRIGLFD